MSYIHCPYDNHYKPGENLRRLFENLVVRPFEEHPRTPQWVEHVVNTNHTYHREKILEQGRSNFTEPYNGLSPEDKVSLYCVYYLPMHLFSSYHIFSKHLTSIGDKVVFIDFGCGPLTSGIAFWAFAQPRDIIYLGIDSSQEMRDKAKKINRYGPNNHEDSFFKDGRLVSDYNRLREVLDKYKYIERDDRTQIIFNFSYFLASETLVIRDLSDVLIQVMERYGHHKACMIYQNPPIPQGLDLHSDHFYIATGIYYQRLNFRLFR